jgi:hypothetical protein
MYTNTVVIRYKTVETKLTHESGNVMKTGVRKEESQFTENILSDREVFVHSYVNHSL